MVTVAVDANGADRGPAEVARGAAGVDGVRVILFGPRTEMGEVAPHVEVVDDDCEVVRRHAVGAHDDQVVDLAVAYYYALEK